MTIRTRLVSAGLRLALALFAAGSASAVTVEYQTTGSFSPGQSNITFGCLGCTTSGGIAYSGSDWVTPSSPATDALGYFYVVNGDYTPSHAVFHLTITETAPSSGSKMMSGILSGTISPNDGGGLSLSFNQSSVTIGTETFELTSKNPFAIRNHGYTELDANIFTTSNAPEPAFYFLTGTAFACLLAMAIRRHRRAAA